MLTAGRTSHSLHRSTDLPGVLRPRGNLEKIACRAHLPHPLRAVSLRPAKTPGNKTCGDPFSCPAVGRYRLSTRPGHQALLACCEGRQSKSPRPRVCRRVQRPQPAEPTGPIQPDSGPHDPSPSGHTIRPAVFFYACTILHGCNLYTVRRGPEWLVHVSLRWVFRLARRQP
jgi:hypothetical protein